MKSKIKKILLDNLKSAYDGGNIDDESIIGSNNTIDQLYDLFVDEMIAIKGESPVKEPKDRFSHFAGTSLFPEIEPKKKPENLFYIEPKKKANEILYTNPKTGKTQKLFDELLPVYTVRYENPNSGGVIYITLCAKDETEAISKAMDNYEFKSHIDKQYYDKSYFNSYKALGNYVIGKVICEDSEPKKIK